MDYQADKKKRLNAKNYQRRLANETPEQRAKQLEAKAELQRRREQIMREIMDDEIAARLQLQQQHSANSFVVEQELPSLLLDGADDLPRMLSTTMPPIQDTEVAHF